MRKYPPGSEMSFESFQNSSELSFAGRLAAARAACTVGAAANGDVQTRLAATTAAKSDARPTVLERKNMSPPNYFRSAGWSPPTIKDIN